MVKQAFPFGHWPSSLSANAVAEGALRFGRIQIAGNAVYWSESRPSEKGRSPVMRWTAGNGAEELLLAPYSARSRVHEYGGGEFSIAAGRLFFVNAADQDVYEAALPESGDANIRRLTNLPKTRFADFAWDSRRSRLICVGETHSPREDSLPVNALWTIPIEFAEGGAGPQTAVRGQDFYANPRLSPCGSKLAFLAWDLPAMPWDAAQLFVAGVGDDGAFAEPVSIAGGNGSACFQPAWAADGSLYFVWDADGFGNLFRWSEGDGITAITHMEAELALPLWSLNAASYALLPDGKACVTFTANGRLGAAILDLSTHISKKHRTGLSAIQAVAGGGESAALVGMSETEPLCIVRNGLAGASAVIRRSVEAEIDPGYVAEARRIEIPGADGPVHGLISSPTNPAASGPSGELPPLIVSLHGGPTGAASHGLRPRTLYFTSRGFAWLDLDYAGSIGYGRAYRDRLKGNWGVADVADAIRAAEFAASAGIADPGQIFVTGGSAGGYTVLMAIATASIFRGAASYYGICDLVQLQKTTHKFENGYQSTLLGATLDENEQLYRDRSPIHHAERINTPLILFQGANDHVVPKEQSIRIAEALRERGISVDYHEFPGEDHGFRQADTIRICLERELAFYRKLLVGE